MNARNKRLTDHFDTIPPRALDLPEKTRITAWYDGLAHKRAGFRRKNSYYHSLLTARLKAMITQGSSVLEIGCADGALLAALNPSRGMGIDISPGMITAARAIHRDSQHLSFFEGDIERTTFKEQFDYVVVSDTLGILLDIQTALDNIRSACRPDTRVILTYHGMLWEPALKCIEGLGLKMPQIHHNWLSREDFDHFTAICDYEIIEFRREMLLPVRIPLISYLLNSHFAHFPFINRFGLTTIASIRILPRAPEKPLSTSIIIPCRNERDNIRPALKRLPDFGTDQEIIFVDGHSRDGTADTIRELQDEFPERKIRLLVQKGRGKSDAVQLGFQNATNDILMILDADLTVPPEELPKFYRAISSGKGEFIAGSRLVYPMEKQAMRTLNIAGNKLFSLLFAWLFHRRIKDTLCGTKVLLRSDYRKMMQTDVADFSSADPFGDFYLLLGAFRLNLKYLEIPIIYRERRYGVTNIRRFYHGYKLLGVVMAAYRRIRQ